MIMQQLIKNAATKLPVKWIPMVVKTIRLVLTKDVVKLPASIKKIPKNVAHLLMEK